MKKITIGDRFKDFVGRAFIVTRVMRNEVRITYLSGDSELWDKKEFLKEVEKARFYPEPKVKVTRMNIADHLLEYQLNLIGKTVSDAIKDDMWHLNWTITPEKYEQFKAYAIPLLKKTFKYTKSKAEDTFNWFNLQFGLRIEKRKQHGQTSASGL